MLLIEYDVDEAGAIHVVALVNAVDIDGDDPHGEAWMTWRRSHEDGGLGCAAVPASVVAELERSRDPEVVRGIVERVLLADRAAKEETA